MHTIKVFSGHFAGSVYDLTGAKHDGCDIVVATTGHRSIAERTGLRLHEVCREWITETNKKHVALAMMHPEKLILVKDHTEKHLQVIAININIDENRQRVNG